MLDVLERPHCAVLYHCVDDLSAVPGVDAKAFRLAEIELLKKSDVVFSTAPQLMKRCREYNINSYYLPNVVDLDHFKRARQDGPVPEEIGKIPQPRLCYHGVLSDFKIDFDLLLEAIALTPELQWVFIGEEREGQSSVQISRMRQFPNVHFLGYRPYAQLPDYLRGVHVGLLPSLRNTYTESMFPMKYYEYIAAGLPVVSTSIGFTKAVKNGIEIGDTANDFVVAIRKQIKRGFLSQSEITCWVANNTWQARTEKMIEIIRQSSSHGFK